MEGPLRLEDFQFLARIGKGQFGKVDAVRFTRDGEVYALKTIDKSRVTRVGQALDVDLEKHVLVHGSIAQLSNDSNWSPVPKLLATISSPSALHIVCSFASCGTLWDLFCSTETTQTDKSKTCFDEQWLQTDEGGDGTLFPSGSQSTDSNSLFKSVGGVLAPSSSRRLPEDTLVFYIKHLVLALQWLHEEVGIVHRDLKPENILLMDDGRAVICDFGSAARLMKEDAVDVREQAEPQGRLWPRPRFVSLSDCQTLHGTADYIAPEVLQTYEQILLNSDSSIFHHESENDSTDNVEERGYDASVDWWSFGAMCYELITGLPPFYAPTIDETYGMIVSCESTLRRPSESACSVIFSDFLAGLLVPSHKRLGKLGPEQVKQHRLLRSTDWEKVRNNDKSLRPSTFQSPRRLDLPSQPPPEQHSLAQSYGSALLGNSSWLQQYPEGTPSSFSVSLFHHDSEKRSGDPVMEEDRWAQWTWVSPVVASLEHPSDVRGHANAAIPSTVAKAGPKLPILDRLKLEATPTRDSLGRATEQHHVRTSSTPTFRPSYGNRFVTPGSKEVLPGSCNVKVPLSVPRSMPRTVARGSAHKMVVMSESKALRLMARCVQQSARKKNIASAKKQKGLAEFSNRVSRESAYLNLGDEGGPNSINDHGKSFLSRLKNVQQPGLAIDKHSYNSSAISKRDLHASYPNLREKAQRHGNAAQGSDHSANAFGFDAFVAELGKIGQDSYVESSPCFARIASFNSWSSGSSADTSICDESDKANVTPPSPPQSKRAEKERSSTSSTRVEGEEKPYVQVTSALPKCMAKDELLRRLFPGFAGEMSQAAQTSKIDRDVKEYSLGTKEVPSRTAEFAFGERDIEVPRLPAEEAYSSVRNHQSDMDGPTVRIAGLVGQHQRMERNLAHLERETRDVKERIEALQL